MFNFFHTIFIKITSVIATAIIAVGLVSVPETPVIDYIKNTPQEIINTNISTSSETTTNILNKELDTEKGLSSNQTTNTVQQQTIHSQLNVNEPQPTSTPATTAYKPEPEKIDPNKTRYIYVAYKKYEGDKFICDGYIDSEIKGLSGTQYCNYPVSQLLLNSYGNSRAVLYIKILNSDKQSLWHKKVLVTTYDGTIRTEKETNEYGIVEVEIYSPNAGNGYATIRTNDDYARDVNFYVSSDKVQAITNFQCNPDIEYSSGTFKSFTCIAELKGDQGQLLNNTREISLEYWTTGNSDQKLDYKKELIKTNERGAFQIKPDINMLKSWMVQNNIRQKYFSYKIKVSVDGLIKESSLYLTIVNDL